MIFGTLKKARATIEAARKDVERRTERSHEIGRLERKNRQ
jgi:hypothetical protein